MINLDFTDHPAFSWYVLLLLFTGVTMVVLSALNVRGQSTGWLPIMLIVRWVRGAFSGPPKPAPVAPNPSDYVQHPAQAGAYPGDAASGFAAQPVPQAPAPGQH